MLKVLTNLFFPSDKKRLALLVTGIAKIIAAMKNTKFSFKNINV